MGMIKEPLAVDFYVDPKPLTTKDQKMISDFIKADKAKRNTGGKAGKSSKSTYTKHLLAKSRSDLNQ
jgi:hypothetical protein